MKLPGRIIIALLLVAGASAAHAQSRTTITDSPHNLSPKTSQGPDVCRYCHAPHGAIGGARGLWNHQLSTSDTKLPADPANPKATGSLPANSPSRLCLSCHDGTVALGSTYADREMLPTSKLPVSGGSLLGTDLQRDHPLSFDAWTRNPNLRDDLFTSMPRKTANTAVKLPAGRVECTTCHEPHTANIDPQRPTKFLVTNNAQGALCKSCHEMDKVTSPLSGWAFSAHATSGSREGAAIGGYDTVGNGACNNCHQQHGASAGQLLRNTDSHACFDCHANSSSTSRWARAWVGHDDSSKFMHPVMAPGHRAGEDLKLSSTPRHSECWDCHNSHATRSGAATQGSLPLSLYGAVGVGIDGNNVAATHEYEVCFKCHADSMNKPQTTVAFKDYGYTANRDVEAHNVRLDFTSPVSHHNVVFDRDTTKSSPAYRHNILRFDGTPGRSLDSGTIACADCHNNDNAAASGGTGANGPHVSKYPHLLERRYDANVAPADPTMAVTSLVVPADGGDPISGPFALCNKCHNVAVLLSPAGDTVFKHHAEHVVQGGVSCAVCHAPHGVKNTGASSQHAGLVNLDLSIVGKDPGSGRLEINTNPALRTCYVSCHFTNSGVKVHSGTSYR